jgi:hypothetical protein
MRFSIPGSNGFGHIERTIVHRGGQGGDRREVLGFRIPGDVPRDRPKMPPQLELRGDRFFKTGRGRVNGYRAATEFELTDCPFATAPAASPRWRQSAAPSFLVASLARRP